MFGKMLSVLYEISKAIKIKKQKDDEKIREYEQRIAELNNNQQVQSLFLDDIYVTPDAIAIGGEIYPANGGSLQYFSNINNVATCLYKNIDVSIAKKYISTITKNSNDIVINAFIDSVWYDYRIEDFNDEFKYIEVEPIGS